MLAPTATDSIPAWKASLLEKRRRQQQQQQQLDRGGGRGGVASARGPGRGDEVIAPQPPSQTPSWKREIYVKKGALGDGGRIAESRGGNYWQDTGIGGPSRVTSSEDRDFTDSEDDLSDSERLIPIQRNPILQSDIQRRPTQNGGPVERSKYSSAVTLGNGLSSSSNHNRSKKKRESGHRIVDEENEANEVTYGRGFVSKLLGRFRELSEKNHSLTRGSNLPKRACSSENLLEAVSNDFKVKGNVTTSGFRLSKGKAQSMENLSSSDKLDSVSHRGRPLSILNGFSVVMPNNSKPNADPVHNKSSGPVSKSVEPASKDNRGNSLSVPIPYSVIVCESSPAPDDELPRSNIVLLTRTVFESIATSPLIDFPKTKTISNLHLKTDDKKSSASRQQNGRSLECDEPDARATGNGQDMRVEDNIETAKSSTSTVDARFQEHRRVGFLQNGMSSDDLIAGGCGQSSGNNSDLMAGSFTNQSGSVTNSFKLSKSEDHGQTGRVVGTRGSHGSTQMKGVQSRNSEPDHQLMILDLKDLPADVQVPVSRFDRNYSASDSRSMYSKLEEEANRKKGRGSLLIRPASNLLNSSTKVEYLNLTKYNDVKTGDFAPPKQRPLYYDDDGDDVEVPVNSFDDSKDSFGFSPKEGDPTIYANHTPVFEFEGAGVKLGRSLLAKTKTGKKLKIHFDETPEEVFEYPSEQLMIEDWIEMNSEDESEEDPSIKRIEQSSVLKNTPGISATGALSSYKSRLQVDYQIGIERPENGNDSTVAPSSQTAKDSDDAAAVAVGDDSVMWSNSSSNDLLF